MSRPSDSDVLRRWEKAGNAVQRLNKEREQVLSVLPWACAISVILGLLIGYGLWGAS